MDQSTKGGSGLKISGIIIAVVVIVIAVIWFINSHGGTPTGTETQSNSAQQLAGSGTNGQSNATSQTTQNQTSQQLDTSNSSIDADIQAADQNATNLDAAGSNIDKSLNDTPVEQVQ